MRCAIGHVLLSFALLISAAVSADGDISDPLPGEGDWKLRKSADGIAVYSRSREGWAIDEIKAEAVVAAPLPVLAALLMDPARRSEWDELCRTGRRIDAPDGSEHHYLQYDMPWPVADRDLVLRVQSVRRGEELIISSRAVPQLLPRQPDMVRIEQAEASYRLSPLNSSETRLVTTALVDPNGPIPAWLLNQLSVGQPFAMIEALRRITVPSAEQ